MITTNCLREISKNSDRSKPPLFCVPGIFGSPNYFTQLSRQIGLGQPFYSWQQASSWGSSFPVYRIETIASQYISSLKEIQPHPPYYLAGHSFGGLIAFEMARQLSVSNEKVALVAILDTAAPIASQKDKLANFVHTANDLDYLTLMKEMFEGTFGPIVQILSQKDSETAVNFEYLFTQLKELFPLLHPEEVIPPEHIFSVFKNNWQAMLDYHPLKIPQVPLSLYRAADKTYGNLNRTIFSDRVINSPTYGWNELADNINVYQTPGNHSTMLTNPHVQVLATLLQSQLK
jgi:thioesterase domain-containing protein